MHLRIWLAMGVAALGWGTSSPATRAALADGIPPVAMTAIRATMAVIAVTLVARATRRSLPRSRELWSLGIVMGTLNLALPFVATTIALQYASSGFVGLLIALVPLTTAVFAHYLLPNEPMYGAKIIGLTIAFFGVGFLLASGDSGIGDSGRPLLAAVLTAISVIAISYGAIHAKQRHASYDPIVLSGMQFAVGAAVIWPVMFTFEGVPGMPSAWGWVLLVYLTIAGSVVPFLLYYWVLKRASTGTASLIAYVVPLVSLTSGIILLDEHLERGIAVGGALILAGVVYLGRAERRRTPAPSGFTPA